MCYFDGWHCSWNFSNHAFVAGAGAKQLPSLKWQLQQGTPIGIGNWEQLGWVCHRYWDLVVKILITNDLSIDLFWKNRFKNFEECCIPLGVSSPNFFATGYAYLDMQACESPTRNRMDWSITLKWCVAKLFHVDERCCHQNLFYRNLYLETFHSTNSLYAAYGTSFGSVCYMLMEDNVLTHVRWFSCGIWGFTLRGICYFLDLYIPCK